MKRAYRPYNIGKNVRTARKMRELKQRELAAICRLKPSAIGHFETGSRVPSSHNLRKLAIALKVSADYLLGINSKI